jgi:hypothetical protein
VGHPDPDDTNPDHIHGCCGICCIKPALQSATN